MGLADWFNDKIADFEGAKAQYLMDLDAKYTEGRAAGKAEIELPNPADPEAKYTQQQMNDGANAAADLARAEKQVEVDAALAKVAALEAVDVAQLVAEAVKAVKAEMVADMENAEIDNLAVIAKYK